MLLGCSTIADHRTMAAGYRPGQTFAADSGRTLNVPSATHSDFLTLDEVAGIPRIGKRTAYERQGGKAAMQGAQE